MRAYTHTHTHTQTHALHHIPNTSRCWILKLHCRKY